MAYRNDGGGAAAPSRIDPLARFLALDAAFDAERGWLGDRVPLRLAAAALITTQGEPDVLAAKVRECDAALAKLLGWFSSVAGSVRMVLAATLVRTGEAPEDFIGALDRAQTLMREAKMSRGGVHEVLAILALRRVTRCHEIDSQHIERLRALYAEMKRRHWFLTGPEDLVACALLCGRAGTAAEIGAYIDAIYDRLKDAPKIWAGDPLQTAANVLGLIPVAPENAATRFLAVASALRDAGVKVRQTEYDDVALLSFVPQPAEVIARMVEEYRVALDRALPGASSLVATGLAASLTFVRIVLDGGASPLADAKLLMEMQGVVAMRQAGVLAAGGG